MMSCKSLLLRLFASSVLAATGTLAHAAPQDPAGGTDAGHRHPHGRDDLHSDHIIVTGHPPIDFSILSATASLEGDDLVARTRGQIGEMLTELPGVSATSFAPGASRPVLRGFSGDRVAVLVDGIGAIDASNVSADHAVVFDPLTVDHIDVLHGPAVLLFGGNAIGGAVNALDKRIPRQVPEGPRATLIGGYATAARERSLGGAVQFRLAPRLAGHLDASWRRSDDLRVGGLVHSRPLRAELLEEAAEHREEGELEEAEEFEELAALSGRVPNSAARSYTLGAGIAFIDAGGDLGLSVQRYDTRYGVPLRPGAGHHHGEEEGAESEEEEHGESVAIDLVQTRIDFRGTLNFDGWLDSVQIRGAYGDYRHVELEGGEVGTRFSGDGIEFRADFIQAERNGWRGRSGIQFFNRDLALVGAEAFVPDNHVEKLGIFTLQALELGRGFGLELAGRYERARIESAEADFRRGFDLWSAAAGLSFEPVRDWKLGVNYIHGARAPSPEELLSDGLHVATQAYEIGDRTFGTERSDGIEAYLRYAGERAEFSLTAYLTEFDDFITALPTGEERKGFPVFRYVQVPAQYKGFEASGSAQIASWDDGELRLDATADYTHARLKEIGPVPRVPPLRLRGGAEVRHRALHLRGEIEWHDRQERVAAFENPVPGFTTVSLSADWHPLGDNGPLTLIVAAENIFDTLGRRAASFTREFVPIAGRDIRATVKLDF